MLCAKTFGGSRFRRYALASLSDLLLRNHLSLRPLSSAAAASPPAPPSSPSLSPSVPAMAARPKDESYLKLVIPKRIALFESIKAQQLSQRQSIAGEPIKYAFDSTSLARICTRRDNAVVWRILVRS